jgi:hypothetical protein
VYMLRAKTGAGYEVIRGASVLCMAIVGIVFSLLLRNEDLGTLLPWVNNVLHYVMPIVVVAYWFVYPPATKIDRKKVIYWLIFPIVYLAYSLLRGVANSWYAYPFLNPSKSGGYGGVALYCVAIVAIFLMSSSALIWGTNRALRATR